uniref:hypothetical protein n=1 Tax=Dorea sp. TaxID=2040332 RepID=UPI003FD783DA
LEHTVHTRGVAGSNPVPAIFVPTYAEQAACGRFAAFLYIVTQQESRKYPVLFLLFNFIYQSIQEKQNRL